MYIADWVDNEVDENLAERVMIENMELKMFVHFKSDTQEKKWQFCFRDACKIVEDVIYHVLYKSQLFFSLPIHFFGSCCKLIDLYKIEFPGCRELHLHFSSELVLVFISSTYAHVHGPSSPSLYCLECWTAPIINFFTLHLELVMFLVPPPF